MNGYKKIIKSQYARFAILRLLSFIPDKYMLNIQYKMKLKRRLNLQNPERYTEKLQWYKLYYRDPNMIQCVDKYYVRDYIKTKGLDAILNTLYIVTDKPEEIDFEKLPEKFIIKTTNGSNTNIICKNKSLLNIKETINTLHSYLNMGDICAGREWAYTGSSKKIIIEELLEDSSNKDNGISDYKFLCFNGKPEYVVYDKDRFTNHKRNIYDINWKYLKVDTDCPRFEDTVPKPKGYEKMLEIAGILSKDFPHVRVDLYNVQGIIYFGELTFYPWSGYVQFLPDEFDYEIGRKFILPNKELV